MKDLLLAMSSLVFLLLYWPEPVICDTLYNNKTALSIGLGTVENGVIHWSDCSGANKKDYKKPPHWVDKADNCRLNPSDFGLKAQDGKYVVADKTKFDRFFPDAVVGDEVNFVKTDKEVEFRYGTKTLKLKR